MKGEIMRGKSAGQSVRRRITVLWFCTVMIMCAACGKADEAGQAAGGVQENTSGEITVQQAVGDRIVYMPETFRIIVPDLVNYFCMTLWENCICYGSQHTVVQYPLFDGTTQMKVMKWENAPGEWNLTKLAFGEDGSIYASVSIPSRPKFIQYVCKFDSEGQLVYARNLMDELEKVGETWSSAWTLEVDGDGHLYLGGESFVWLFDTDGSYAGSLSMDEARSVSVKDMEKTKDGKLYVIYQNNGDSKCYLAEIDFNNKETIRTHKIMSVEGMAAGAEEGLLVYDSNKVYRYDAETLTLTPLLDWTESNLNGSYIRCVETTEDNRILAVSVNSSIGGNVTLLRGMTEAEAEKLLQEKEKIKLAVFGSPSQDLKDAVVKFNKESELYSVILEEYTAGDTDAETASGRLNSEIAADNSPDLIDVDFGNIDSLTEKGAFENLYDYLERSSVLSADDFVETVLREYTVGDVLVAIPHEFQISVLIGGSDMVGEKMGWTLEEMIAFAEEHPDGELFSDSTTKAWVLYDMLRFNEELFMDWENGVCHFDSDSFKSLLQFANRFPDKYVTPTGNSASPYTKIEQREALLSRVSIGGFRDLQPFLEAYGGELTCIGYPSPEKVGCAAIACDGYAISSQSRHKEAAWAFLEYYLQYTNAKSPNFRGANFVSYKPVLQAKAQESLISDESAVSYFSDGWRYSYRQSTKEENDEIFKLIEEMQFVSFDENALDIILEEAGSYFAGQKSIDDVVRIIQNRVRNYMDEGR